VYSSQALYKNTFHKYQYLLDSTMEIKKIFKVAKAAGLGAISITDHGETRAVDFINKNKINAPISVSGVEIKTNLGEILVYGDIKKIDLSDSNYFKIVRQAKKEGCFIIIPHPFLENPFGYNGLFCKKNLENKKVLEEALSFANAMEVYYLRTGIEDKLIDLAKKHSLVPIATSDSHYYSQIGKVYTEIPDSNSEEEVLQNLKQGKILSLRGTPTLFELKTLLNAFKGQTIDRFKKYQEFEML